MELPENQDPSGSGANGQDDNPEYMDLVESSADENRLQKPTRGSAYSSSGIIHGAAPQPLYALARRINDSLL